jgi:putative phosphoesterase
MIAQQLARSLVYHQALALLNPMAIGLISDIHADIRALETTLRRLEAAGVDHVICVGDLVGYGTEPNFVAALLHNQRIPCIRGNHDRWALERRQMIGLRGWKPAALNDDTWEFLGNLPAHRRIEHAGRIIEVHHGSPASDTEYVSAHKAMPGSIERFWSESDADLLILGHTHIPMIDRGPQGTVINPGSVVGVPGIQTSYSFAVVELDSLTVRLIEVRTGRELCSRPLFLAPES